jgi:sialidase-1
VLLNGRSESHTHRRLLSTSKDGATSWSKPAFHDQLLEPICMASMVRFSAQPADARNRLLFSNPDTLEPRKGTTAKPGTSRQRKNLTVQLSYDEAETWAVKKTLEPGGSGYSDLAVLPDKTILCLYERWDVPGRAAGAFYLSVARFNLEWLTGER